ncbi:MAG: hypothetical protein V2A79_00870 [Planctomycetota bacterium]
MGLSSNDIEKLSKDIFTERRLGHSVFCGNCGYNLRTLPYIGRCPECGNEYNARPAVRKGIYVSTEVWFPGVELLCTVFFLGWAGVWLSTGFKPVVPWQVTFGSVFLIVGGISAYLFYRRLGRYLHFLWVARHLEDD